MLRRKHNQGGQSLIEFALLGIPMMFMSISVVAISIDMWEYHNLAYATEMTARYITVHGASCSQNGNTCTIQVKDVAAFFAAQAMALNPGSVNVSLTDGSGTTTCNPVNTCNSTTTQFPSTSYNNVGQDVTVQATYVLKNPLPIYWPPRTDAAHDYTVGATSRQWIVF
jgi:Flp pilus assembly protein TadG